MPSLQPIKLTVSKDDFDELIKQLNYLFKDIYNYIDTIQGVDNKTFAPKSITLPPGTGVIGSAFEATNYTETETFDANATTIHELADVVGTLIEALKSTS